MDAYLAGQRTAAEDQGDDNERPSKRVKVGTETADDDSFSNSELLNDNDPVVVIDILLVEAQDPTQMELVSEVLTSDRDVEDDEDEQDLGLDIQVSGENEATFEDNAGELLAYMGLPATDKISWASLFLDLCEPGDYILPLRRFLSDCKLRSSYRGESSEQVDAFLNRRDRDTWATHDAQIDTEWDRFAAEIVDLSQNNIVLASLSKPSGPLNAVLTMNWHFPTWSTQAPFWSHVMDPTNPSLRAQKEKYGLNSFIRTQNRLPIREHYKKSGVNWDDIYPNWTAIEEKCLSFNKTLNRHSKLIMVIGTENVRSFEKLIEYDSATEELVQVKLRIPQVKTFGDVPNFVIIQNKTSREVRQVVFFSYHSQTFFARDVNMPSRAYHDFLWNAVADMAMVLPLNRGDMYFTRQVGIWRPVSNKADIYKNTQMHLAVRLRNNEKKSGVLLPENAVRHAFRKTLSKRPELSLIPDSTGSFVRAILRYFISKAQQTINDPAWRRTPAYDRMYASHVQNFANHSATGRTRGLATRQTEAYRSSESGRYSAASLGRSATLPRNKQAERIAALLKVKQVRELRDADTNTLDVKQRAMQDRIRNLQSMDKKKLGSFFRQYVVWWAPWHPRGLRYDGDGCEDSDDFDYDGQDHPAVQVTRAFKSQEKKAFVVQGEEVEDE
ncbi:uncharacterized protein FTOL_05128 [Fusarium torulosum]|uniref:Uncharacterized protein n=1 Tax=Fusarium torulosum TaxID=33205 RepID=A0AAE8M706_9HYPO|nr:uncharacterized protein FTOL_05128 [Fusarium torulosum]